MGINDENNNTMNVLLIGGGGREHAIAWKLKQSPRLNALYIAPGNAGTSDSGENVALDPGDFNSIKRFTLSYSIDLVVVGPEAMLIQGLADFFAEDKDLQHILFFGPQKKGALLEGSKDWAKQFMQRHHIPTARSRTFTRDTLNEGIAFLKEKSGPYVLKADGLAAGKGVLIAEDKQEAIRALSDMLENQKFGEASAKVVIEDFLSGTELSVFVITDGVHYKLLPEAKDYKRIGEGDTGLNTGGMGAISPVPFADDFFMKKVEQQIIKPTIRGLQTENIPYCGFIFFGLINVEGNPYVIEYNARMGDPEAEVVIPRLEEDLLLLMKLAAEKKLSSTPVKTSDNCAATVMMVSGGYPEKYDKGKTIQGLEKVSETLVFHAGTKAEGNLVKTSGGRVLAVTSLKPSMESALDSAYAACQKISFENSYYRTDLGQDLKKYQQ